jgi:hypothetical protein
MSHHTTAVQYYDYVHKGDASALYFIRCTDAGYHLVRMEEHSTQAMTTVTQFGPTSLSDGGEATSCRRDDTETSCLIERIAQFLDNGYTLTCGQYFHWINNGNDDALRTEMWILFEMRCPSRVDGIHCSCYSCPDIVLIQPAQELLCVYALMDVVPHRRQVTTSEGQCLPVVRSVLSDWVWS